MSLTLGTSTRLSSCRQHSVSLHNVGDIGVSRRRVTLRTPRAASEDAPASTTETKTTNATPFGISGSRTELDEKTKELQKAGNMYADDENPWAPKKPSKLKFTDVIPWDEFMQVYDQDTCYQRLYRTLVTTLVYRKNIVVTEEQFQELARILVPMLMKDGFVYGLDGVPREHKAWRIVDRWVEAVVEEDRVKRLKGESVKPAKVGTRGPNDRPLKLSPDKMVSNPGNRHRDFRGDDFRLPDSINALPDV